MVAGHRCLTRQVAGARESGRCCANLTIATRCLHLPAWKPHGSAKHDRTARTIWRVAFNGNLASFVVSCRSMLIIPTTTTRTACIGSVVRTTTPFTEQCAPSPPWGSGTPLASSNLHATALPIAPIGPTYPRQPACHAAPRYWHVVCQHPPGGGGRGAPNRGPGARAKENSPPTARCPSLSPVGSTGWGP